MRVLVDTNVLLDVGLQREGFLADSMQVLRWCANHPGRAFIAWHSLSNVYYIMRKQCGDRVAREFAAILLEDFEIPATGSASAKHALHLPMTDLEDALQVVAAIAAAADVIVTRDVADYRDSTVPARTPAEFLASFTP